MEKFAKVAWTVGDIQSMYDVSEERAEEWLEANAKYLQDAMVQAGWVVIETLSEDMPLVEEETTPL